MRKRGEKMSRKIKVLSSNEVSKVFKTIGGPLPVLSKITFDVLEGDAFGIVGPSGCGKSTLLHILGGLIIPSDGTVQLHGKVLTEPSHEVSYVFQEDSLLPWRTTYGNVLLGAGKNVHSDPQSSAYEYLRMVELAGFEKFYPSQLSGGMRQRTVLARALVSETPILLLDEPLGSLDLELREALQEQILMLHDKLQRTMVIVTHDIDEVVYLCDKIMVLSERPAHTIALIDNSLPRPRIPKMRISSEFNAIRVNIWKKMR